MKNVIRIISLVIILSSLVIGISSFTCFAQDKIVIEVAHMYAEGDPNTIGVEAGKKYIEDKTNGRITFAIYPNGSYGEQFNCSQAVRMGTLDMFAGGFAHDFYKPSMAIQGPFIFRDYEHWRKFKESELCKEIVANTEKNGGFKVVGIHHYGFRQTLTKTPAETVEDFSKLRLRVVNVAPYPLCADVLGAKGTPVPIVDVYLSLQTGIVDGTENPIPQMIAMTFYEVAKYLLKTDHMLATQYWMVSNKRWNSLSQEDQKILEET